MKLESILSNKDVAIRMNEKGNGITMVTKNSLRQIVFRDVSIKPTLKKPNYTMKKELEAMDDWEIFGEKDWWQSLLKDH